MLVSLSVCVYVCMYVCTYVCMYASFICLLICLLDCLVDCLLGRIFFGFITLGMVGIKSNLNIGRKGNFSRKTSRRLSVATEAKTFLKAHGRSAN